MNIRKIFQKNKDIREFFENKIGEKYVLQEILNLADGYTEQYIEWKKTLPTNENIFEKYVRLNKIAVHAAKYNKKNLRGHVALRVLLRNIELADDIHKDDICSFTEVKEQPDFTNQITVSRRYDILNCISFRKYKPGAIFNIIMGGQVISSFTLTKENRYDMFIPINNRFPLFLVSLNYMEVYISSPNTILNKPIFLYGTVMDGRDRNELKGYNESIYRMQIDNNGSVFKYHFGIGHIE